MNVKESTDITNCISNLRKDVYNTEFFKRLFTAQLESSIHVIDVEYIPEQLGGFSIRANVDRNACKSLIPSQHSEYYVTWICSAYQSVLAHIFNTYPSTQYIEEDFLKICGDNNISNLVNVVISGDNMIIIQI